MTEYPPIQIPLLPTLDVRRLNVIIGQMKSALGPLGEGIELIDPKKLNAEMAKVQKELSGIDKQFEKAFSSKSVEEMRAEIQQLLDQVDQLDEKGKDGGFADKYFKFQALAEGAQLFQGISDKAAETQQAMRLLEAQTGATGAELERLKDTAANIYSGGGFESMAEAVKATATAAQQLGEYLDPQGLEDFTRAAAGIGKTFDKDVNEVISKSRTFIANFGLEGQEAGDLISLAMREGGSGMDDVLDTMDEYSQLAKNAGLSAEQFVSILTTGVKAGARDTDKLADSLKEAGIRLNAGDTKRALAEIDSEVARTLEGIEKRVQSGDIDVGSAIQMSAAEIEKAFDAGEITDAVRQQLQVAVGGTMAEDIGTTLWGDVFSAPIDEAAITERARQAGQQIGAAIEPPNVFAKLQLQAEAAFGSLAGFIGPTLGPMSQFAQIAGQAGPAMDLLGDTKAAKGLAELGKNALGAVKGLFASTGATSGQTTATGGATVATGFLNVAMRALPIFAIIGAVGLLAAAFGAFSSSTEDVIAGLDETREAAAKTREELAASVADTSASDQQAQALKGLAAEYRELENSTTTEGQQRFAAASTELANKVPIAKEAVEDFNEAGKGTEDQYKINTDIVNAFADSTLRQNEAIRQGNIAEAAQRMRDLSKETEGAKEKQAELAKDLEYLRAQVAKGEGALGGQGLFGPVTLSADEAIEKLNELEAENKNLETSIGASTDEARQMAKALLDSGAPIETIVQRTGKSKEQLEKMKKEAELSAESLEDAGKAADGTARATKGMGDAAARSQDQVKKLAEVYQEVKSAADSSYSTAFNGVLGIWQLQREVNRDLEIQRTKLAELQRQAAANPAVASALQPTIALMQATISGMEASRARLKQMEVEEKNAAREALKEKRRLEAEEKRLRIELGEITVETKDVTDFKEQADAIRQQIEAVLFGIVNSSVADKVQAEIDKVNQTLKTELENLDKEIKKVEDARAKGGTQNAQLLIDQLNFLKQAKENEAQAEITRIQIEGQDERLDKLREYLGNQQRLIDAATDRRIASLQRESDRITVTDEASFQRALQKRLEIMDLQQAKEINAVFQNNELFLRAMEQVQNARRDFENAKTVEDKAAADKAFNEAQQGLERIRTALISGDRDILAEALASDDELARLRKALATVQSEIATATSPEVKQAAENRKKQIDTQIAAQQEYLDELLTLSLETGRDLAAIEERFGAEALAAQEELGSALYDQKVKDLERLRDLEELASTRRLEIARNQYEAFISGMATGMTAVLEREIQEQMDQLDRIREETLLSEQSYEDRRLKIEEEAQKKRTLIAAFEEGSRAALEIAAQEESLQRQIELLQKKEEVARKLGLTEIAAEVGAELELLKGELASKGSQIAALADELSPKLGDAFSGLFTGNDEQAKEGFRSYFGGLAAGLKQLAAAKISEALLNMIGPGGITGLIAGFALRPLVTGIVNAALSPILDGLLSFSTGGRIDSPTMFIAGDGGRLGGGDREWIFRDDQLRLLVASAMAAQQAGMVEELHQLRLIVANWPTQLVAKGQDLKLAQGRARSSQESRTIGPFAPRKAA